MSTTYHPKDFILTDEGLAFAVVAADPEDGRILSFLRYQQQVTGWKKLDTQQANTLLNIHYPHYLYYSALKDTQCHAVPVTRIKTHKQPRQGLHHLLQSVDNDPIREACRLLFQLLQKQGISTETIGITGSLLMGAQHATSDIDVVFYDREVFAHTRQQITRLLELGLLQPLKQTDWLDSYQRRGCDLSFAEYVWHEQRKANKVMVHNRKVDLSLVMPNADPAPRPYKKQGLVTQQLRVIDDRYAYDYPAEFIVDHPILKRLKRILCYTATYTGQAHTGEWIEVAGQLEIAEDGQQRLVVGASREAHGEYIKVIHANV